MLRHIAAICFSLLLLCPILAEEPAEKSKIFNGEDLQGWEGNQDLWKVENGEIVGSSPGIDRNEFLVYDKPVKNFRLSLEVKLVPNTANSGVQFRSRVNEERVLHGYQADIGEGWWGKLYHEEGRGLLWDKSAEQSVKVGEWNTYEIEAVGHHIRTYINGQPSVDLEDPEGELEGVIALQIHSGPQMEVRFRNIELQELPEE